MITDTFNIIMPVSRDIEEHIKPLLGLASAVYGFIVWLLYTTASQEYLLILLSVLFAVVSIYLIIYIINLKQEINKRLKHINKIVTDDVANYNIFREEILPQLASGLLLMGRISETMLKLTNDLRDMSIEFKDYCEKYSYIKIPNKFNENIDKLITRCEDLNKASEKCYNEYIGLGKEIEAYKKVAEKISFPDE